jgi:purine nucleoside phosphorylase
MSTVLEVIQARALEVAGFSCLTNLTTGLPKEKLSHDELLAVGRHAAASSARLVTKALAAATN